MNTAPVQPNIVCIIDTRTRGFLDPLVVACDTSGGKFTVSKKDRHIEWSAVSVAWTLVCHVFDKGDGEELDQWEQLRSMAREGAVLIRVSTEPKDPPRPTYSDGRYVLHLCLSTRDLSAEQWIEILEGIGKESGLEELLSGHPCPLAKYFVSPRTEYLVALAIRCQCYLAAYAERRGKVWGPASISVALTEMEWDQFIDRGSAAAERVSTLLLDQKELITKKVRGSNWWRLFGEEDPVDVCRREWGHDLTGWEELRPLLELIAANKDIPEPSAAEHPVALAFLSLHGRLGKRIRL